MVVVEEPDSSSSPNLSTRNRKENPRDMQVGLFDKTYS